jgi:hypothetical protein
LDQEINQETSNQVILSDGEIKLVEENNNELVVAKVDAQTMTESPNVVPTNTFIA